VLSIEKAQVIYEPIDPSNYKLYDPPAVRQEFNFALDSFIIGVIARIHPAKGQYEFIKAMAEELRRDSKLFIIIAGDIVPRTLKNRLYKRKIENFIQQNQLKNVILLGFRDDIDKILSLCDICVYPFSRREPFGIAAAESLAFNKPTLFPKCGGLQEISDIFEKGEDFSIKKVKDRIALLTKSPHRGQSLISIPNKLSFGNYKDAVHNVFKN
jgi:glycosyltransferase involved in cell wall biosynthesis